MKLFLDSLPLLLGVVTMLSDVVLLVHSVPISPKESSPNYFETKSNRIQEDSEKLFPAQNPFVQPVGQHGPAAITGADRRLQENNNPLWGFDAVQAGEMHERGFRGQGIKICMVGSGLDASHPEFQQTMIDGYSGNPQVPWDQDPIGYGTAYTGVMAASDTNGLLLDGVAPASEYYIVRVFDDDGTFTFTSDIVGAVEVCLQNGTNIINLALAGGESETDREAFSRFADRDVLLVAAAGNAGPGAAPSFPASYPGVVSVGAIDSSREVAGFSNTNEFVDLVAPGVNIFSTSPQGYKIWFGTGVATAYVSSVAALLWSAKPNATAAEIQDALFEGAFDLGPPGRDHFYGYGLVQAANSLNVLLHGPMPSRQPSMLPSVVPSSSIQPSQTVVPSSSLQPSQTVVPTRKRLSFGGWRRDYLMRLVQKHLSFTSFADPLSPQNQALGWVANDHYAFGEMYMEERLLQRFALATAFYAFGLSEQGLELEPTDECEWDWGDINCNSESEVTMVEIYDKQLTGTIPPELSALSALSYLNLGWNQLMGTIPPEISALTSLVDLTLWRNQLVGTVPTNLTSLVQLRNLTLSENILSGTIFPGLGSLTQLWNIYLDNNQLTGTIPSELGNLGPLGALALHNNGFMGSIPSELCAISIESLSVDCDDVSCSCCPSCG